MDKKELTIIIPAYNEAESLEKLLPKLTKAINTSNLSFEILVLDTIEKKDNTDELCAKFNASHIRRECSNNYCDAVKTGIKYAKGEKILFMDADGSHNADFIPELIKYKDDYDVVIASRYVKGGGSANIAILKWMSLILNKTYSMILRIKCNDISNGFKLYDGKQLKKLNLRCDNFDIIEEILYKLYLNNPNLKLKEVPYFFENRKFGKTKRKLLLFTLSYLHTLIRLKYSNRG